MGGVTTRLLPPSFTPRDAPLITGNDKQRRASSNHQKPDGLAELVERVALPQIDFLRHA